MNLFLGQHPHLSAISKKKGKYGKYKVEVHSGKYSIWYIKGIWKLQIELADSRINWLMR